MPKFEFSYDKENDDLFLYKKGSKSKGSIELGDLILDFDSKDMVAVEFVGASHFISDFLGEKIPKGLLENLKECRIDVLRRAPLIIRVVLLAEKKLEVKLVVPEVIEKSPALLYA
jgi:uncharacterized protein YuzE